MRSSVLLLSFFVIIFSLSISGCHKSQDFECVQPNILVGNQCISCPKSTHYITLEKECKPYNSIEQRLKQWVKETQKKSK